MANSIERQTEDRFISLINSVTGINIYNADRFGNKDYYGSGVTGALVVQATNLSKELSPNCGVFQVGIALDFGVKLADCTPTGAASKWEEIRQTLYHDTSIESRLSITGFTVYGVTKESEEVAVDDETKLWKKTLNLKVWVTPL